MGTTEVDLEELAALPALAGCTRTELRALDARTTELRVRAGRVICHGGARARELVILLDGYATRSQDGELLSGQVGPGTILGGAEVASGLGHEVTVTTRSVVRLLVVGAAEYADLRAVAPGVADRLLGILPAGRITRAKPTPTPVFAPAAALRTA